MSSVDGNAHQGVTAENRGGQQYVKHAEGNQNVNTGGTQHNSTHNTFHMSIFQGTPDGIPGLFPLTESREQKKTTREIMLNWLRRLPTDQVPLDLSLHHRRLHRQVSTGTGTTLAIDQILDSVEFNGWKGDFENEHSRILGINGIFGSGKSTLASFIVKSIENENRERRDVACAYFYFQEGKKHRIPATRVWTTLLAQLLQQDLEYNLESSNYDTLQGSAGLESDEYIELFQARAAMFKTVYLVIDGLDSCQDLPGEKTQDSVRSTLKGLPNNIRILFTCRNKEVGLDFKAYQKLSTSPIKKDVTTYVKNRIEDSSDLKDVLASGDYRQRVISDVTTMTLSSKMFLLAKLHMDYLSKKTTWNDVQMALSKLPDSAIGESGAFEDAARRMAEIEEEDYIRLARHIITWVVHARVEVNAEQIRDSFAVHKSQGKPYQDDRPIKERLMPLCNGLVIMDPEKETLSLVHEAARAHLEDHGMIAGNADMEMGKTCLFYLLVDQGEEEADPPLLQYAAEHWWAHLRNDEATLDSEIHELMFSFLTNNAKLTRAFKAIGGADDGKKLDNLTGLHAAVHFDLPCSLVECLLDSGVNIDAQCGDGQTALHWAVRYGRRELLGFLIDKSANANICDELGQAPLHKTLIGPTAEDTPLRKATWRSANDDEAVVLALIRGGAKLTILSKRGLSPLSTSIRYGPTSLAKLMIRNQQDINAEIYGGWTSLREVFYHAQAEIHQLKDSRAARSAQQNHARILTKELLDLGVDLNRRSTIDGWTPLTYAAKNGEWSNMIRMLSRHPHPADVHLRDGEGLSPLYWAIGWRGVREIELLASYGADVNETYHHGTEEESWPLLETINHDNNSSSIIAEILIRSGATVHRRMASGSTLLIEAVKRGDSDTAWVLLKAGAAPDEYDQHGNSALLYAVQDKKRDLVWLLLSRQTPTRGTEATEKDEREREVTRALEIALTHEDLRMAWLLQEHGASVQGRIRDDGFSPLHWAASNGKLEIARFLVGCGATLDSADQKYGFTPLHHAIRKSHDDMIDFLSSELVSAKKDINQPNGQGETPVIMAVIRRQPKAMETLNKKGAYFSLRCLSGLSALHHAVLQDFHQGVSLILDKPGIEPNIRDTEHDSTPLHLAVSKGCDEAMMDLLVNAEEVDIEARDAAERTPLMLAAQLGRDKLVEYLLRHKADPRARGPNGMQAVDYAVGEDCVAAREKLMDWFGDDDWYDAYD